MLCSVPLSDVKAKSPRWRFNISLLSNQTFITSLKEYIKKFLEINMPSDVDPQILWETTKCAIRGFCISFSSTLAKAKTHQFTQLENKIQSLQNLQKQHFTEQQATQLSSLKEEYDLLSHSKAEFSLHRSRQKYYLESERPRTKYCLPASAYFVFLQLRSALKAYGVPWASSISSHPMRDWIASSAGRPSVSLIYNKIIDCITKPLSIKTIWNKELSDLNLSVDWERVWSNLSLTSKNLAHRLIHFKVIHRAYITPYKRFKMNLLSNLNYHICNTTSSGTFLHMFWECSVVISLWTHVNLVLSSLLRIDWSVNPSLCLLNDDSGLCISSMQKRMLFAGFTAAKKTIIQNWFTPHIFTFTFSHLADAFIQSDL